MARRKRKNPNGTATNVIVALGAGIGVYLIARTLQKNGLGDNGDEYEMPKLPPPAVTYRKDFYPSYVRSYQPSAYIWQLRPTAPVGLRPPHLTEEGSFGSKEAREIFRQRMDEARAEKAIRDYGRYATSPSANIARLAYERSWLGKQKAKEEKQKSTAELMGAFLRMLNSPSPSTSAYLEREKKREKEIEKAKTMILPEV